MTPAADCFTADAVSPPRLIPAASIGHITRFGSCFKTHRAPKGRAIPARRDLGSAEGYEAETLRTQPCKGEIPWFVAPLQGLPEWEIGLDDPGRWLGPAGRDSSPLSGLRF
jgi:hypothetical protein